MTLAKTNFVTETIDLIKQIETRFLELGARLYRIREEELWQDGYSSYFEFLEAAHINPSIASRLTKIHEFYVLGGGKPQERLAGIGYTNLYEAIPLIETQGVDTAIVKAETLTRSEIKEEVSEMKNGVHTHVPKDDQRYAFCSCGKLIRVNEEAN